MEVFKYQIIFTATLLSCAIFIRATPSYHENKQKYSELCKVSEKHLPIHTLKSGSIEQHVLRRKRLIPKNIETKRSLASNKDSILGQSLPTNPLKPSLGPDSIRRTLLDVRQRLRTLANQHPASRAASTQLDAIRTTLRDLSNKVAHYTPEQRANVIANRAKFIEQRKARERQMQRRLDRLRIHKGLLPMAGGVVGATASQDVTTVKPLINRKRKGFIKKAKSEANDDFVPTYSSKDVITQPKNLISD